MNYCGFHHEECVFFNDKSAFEWVNLFFLPNNVKKKNSMFYISTNLGSEKFDLALILYKIDDFSNRLRFLHKQDFYRHDQYGVERQTLFRLKIKSVRLKKCHTVLPLKIRCLEC